MSRIVFVKEEDHHSYPRDYGLFCMLVLRLVFIGTPGPGIP